MAATGFVAPALQRSFAVDTAKCIGVGLALGIVFGVALHSYVFGIVIGVAVGLLLCFVWRRRVPS